MFSKLLLKIPHVALLLCLLVCVPVSDSRGNASLARQKRLLLFEPEINIIQLIIGIGVPVELKLENVVWGWAYRSFYNLPTNISELMPMDQNVRRGKRSISRWHVYKLLEHESNMRGLGGRPCILQAICEHADIPIDKYYGVLEELFHSLFTPTTTNEDIIEHSDNEYYAAQKLGRKYKGRCKQLFPDCRLHFLDIFTRIDDYDYDIDL